MSGAASTRHYCLLDAVALPVDKVLRMDELCARWFSSEPRCRLLEVHNAALTTKL